MNVALAAAVFAVVVNTTSAVGLTDQALVSELADTGSDPPNTTLAPTIHTSALSTVGAGSVKSPLRVIATLLLTGVQTPLLTSHV